MLHDVKIADFQIGDVIEGFYILKDASAKTTANGRPYLQCQISDCSGFISAYYWDYPGPIGVGEIGHVVKVRGEVTSYRGGPQFTGHRIRIATEKDEYDRSTLIPTAPIDSNERMQEIWDRVHSMEDADYRRICEVMLERHGEAFQTIPAAKTVHHSFVSGLLMHTSNMLRTADFLSDVYAEIIDRSLLLAGTLLHDFAKREEFLFSELGLATNYSVKGQLLGHLVMGAQEVAAVAAELGVSEEKSVLLQHMLLSHHGQPEFGAAVVPMCAEAELLSEIDLIDSRMEIYAENLAEIPVGSFTNRIFALEKKIYRHKSEENT